MTCAFAMKDGDSIEQKPVTIGIPVCIGIPDWLFDNVPQLKELKERVIFTDIHIHFHKFETRVKIRYIPRKEE